MSMLVLDIVMPQIKTYGPPSKDSAKPARTLRIGRSIGVPAMALLDKRSGARYRFAP
jgi:hypothetical protein